MEDTAGDDTGNITCTAENIVGRVQASLRLVVEGIRLMTKRHVITLLHPVTYDVLTMVIQFTAPPKIVKLEVRQEFHWCIYYELKGYPPPNRTWYFNEGYLLHSNDIVDVSESPLKGI